MKLASCLTAFALFGGAIAIEWNFGDTPMARTVKLIESLEKKVKEDGKKEQAEFGRQPRALLRKRHLSPEIRVA